MNLAELTELVGDLTARVAALEAPPPERQSRRPTTDDLAIVHSIVAALDGAEDGPAGAGTVLYAGAGRAASGLVAWQMDRPWSALTAVDSTSIARSLAALGNPQRVQIVQLLVQGPATTAELTARLDEPSSGSCSTTSRSSWLRA